MGIFKSIGKFITVCEEYLEYRIITGKFIRDLSDQNVKLKQSLDEKSKTDIIKPVTKSKPHPFFTSLLTIWNTLLKFWLFENIVTLLMYAIKIISVFYIEISLVTILVVPLIILLFILFENSVASFFIFLMPTLLLIIYCLSAFYYCIDKRDHGEKISFWRSIFTIRKNISDISFPFIIHFSMTLISCVSFFILSFFLSYLFDLTKISWESSFVYWFVVAFLSIAILIGLLLLTIIMQQAYFATLLRQVPFQKALRGGWIQLKRFPFHFFFLYVLFYLSYGVFAWKITLSYLYLGIILSFFFITILSLFLGYLLYRKFPYTLSVQEHVTPDKEKLHSLFYILVGFGIVNYWLIGILVMRQSEAILAFVQQQQASFVATQDVRRYTNSVYRYTLEYPQAWTLYERKNNTVTFYDNYTGNIKGGTWFSITVSPFDQGFFTGLYKANPGIVEVDESQDIMTKIGNIVVQQKEGINYTYIKHGTKNNQYETHYLIHKGDYMYDLAFISVSNDVNEYTSDLFDKIVNSFQFIE
ncbi:MAG: PsbP-related protein [Candidatus Levyibacteriota bacterium]